MLRHKPPIIMSTFATAAEIRLLPEDLINKIAAGEVVDRPASVVKELVENALDAGATRIDVQLKGGGVDSIRVSDNGCGILPDALALALERHATSKISAASDLEAIHTLGFRGEALSSIAAVSRFRLTSRIQERLSAVRLECEGGAIRATSEVGAPVGTEVCVEDLFFNTPARRKFLRSAATEFGHVQEALLRLALLREGVAFSLSNDEREIFSAPANATIAWRARELLVERALRTSEFLTVIDTGQAPGGLRLRGLISSAEYPGTSRDRLYTYVNGRFVRDRGILHAVTAAYREVLPQGRYPLVALDLAIDAREVDVNVHPAKAEVRFTKPGAIHDFVFKALRKFLSQGAVSPPSVDYAQRPQTPALMFRENSSPPYSASSRQAVSTPVASALFEMPRGRFARLRVVGQWMESYIVCEERSPDGHPKLCLIDQHAAHERIGYERLKKAYKDKNLATQTALIAATIELDAHSVGLLIEHLEKFKHLGLDLEAFGHQTVMVRSVPALLKEASLEKLLRSLSDDLRLSGASQSLDDLLDRILMTFSCHTMVRANHRLEMPEMQALLKALDEVDFAAKCPHGRPVVVEWSLAEIEKRFGRT